MRDFLISQWRGIVGTVGTFLAGTAIFRFFYKYPRVKWFFRPNDAQADLIAAHQDLSRRFSELEQKYKAQEAGKEFLLDELSIARAVRDNQRDQLDMVKAAESDMRARLEAVKQQLGHDVL